MTSLPPDCDPAAGPAQGLGLDELPSELQDIQHDLLADAAEWARGVPPSARFNQRLRAVLPLDEPASAAESAPRQTQVVHHAPGEAPNEPRPQHVRADVRAHPTRLGTMLALAATIAVVALLAAVFATLRPGGEGSHHSATSTSTATPQPIVALPLRATYSGQPGIPVVAASNPDMIYEYSDATATPVLRRSDDGGANWHALAYPTALGAFVSNLLLAVNPDDAANVFLQVALGYFPGQAGACKPSQPVIKSFVCVGEYASSDSGAHWTPMSYPVPGTLFPNGMTFSYDSSLVQAQGGRVYAAFQDNNTAAQPATQIRILSSTDHGATWHVADAALAAAGVHICDFEAAPEGATLFARTAAICQGEGFTPRQLWRSDDAGAHWHQVTSFAAPFNSMWNTFTVASATVGESNQVILYEGARDHQTGATPYYASLDGGATWQPAPTAGLPDGAQAVPAPLTPGQTLRDGTLVVAFRTGGAPNGGPQPGGEGPTPTPSPLGPGPNATITCYAWRPGSARWVPFTQPAATGGLSLANLYVADGAHRAVVLSLGDSMMPGTTYTIERFA